MENSGRKFIFKQWESEWKKLIYSDFMDLAANNQTHVQAVTKQMADRSSAGYVRLCSDWADALRAVLRTLEITEEDAIFLPGIGPGKLLNTVVESNAKIELCDIHPRTFTIDILSLQQKIKTTMSDAKYRARVIIALDVFGLPADYPALLKICEKYGLFLIDLAIDGPGGSIQRQEIPVFGTAGICSFTPGSTVSAFFDAAAIYTDSQEMNETLESMQLNTFDDALQPMTKFGSLNTIHPLEVRSLERKYNAFYDNELARRNELASFFSSQLKDILDPPFVPAGFTSAWAKYCVILPKQTNRNLFIETMKENGYEISLPAWSDFAAIGSTWGIETTELSVCCPNASDLIERAVLLPFYPYLNTKDAAEVCRTLARLWPMEKKE